MLRADDADRTVAAQRHPPHRVCEDRLSLPGGACLTARAGALAAHPASLDVAVARSPRAKLQAVGRDRKDHWQYLYNEAAVREREQKKYDRLVAFGRALPKMRAAIDRGMRLQGLPREKVMACILRILSTCFMRPGSQVYAKENASFGIATLQNRHASVHGDLVRFSYTGEGGKHHERELRDRRVARIVRELKKLPGRDLFEYVGADGAVVDIRCRHINGYIKEVMGERSAPRTSAPGRGRSSRRARWRA